MKSDGGADWTAQMCAVWEILSREEHAALNAHQQAAHATHTWPGWVPYIGAPPPVRLTAKKHGASRRLAAIILERDGYACRHCATGEDLTIDHVIPESRGGTREPENMQTLCRRCNSRKGSR